VRELILSATARSGGRYSAGGEVLMGTLRWEKRRGARQDAAAPRRVRPQAPRAEVSEADTRARIKAMENDLGAPAQQLAQYSSDTKRASSPQRTREGAAPHPGGRSGEGQWQQWLAHLALSA